MSYQGKTLIVYHKNCMDGYMAGYAAWKEFGTLDTHYVAAQYGDTDKIMAMAEHYKTIHFLDFSLPRTEIEKLFDAGKSIVILDHHKTAIDDLIVDKGRTFTGDLDTERSGAGIAWDYYHPLKMRPLMIDLTEDRDLWRFKNPLSKHFHTGAKYKLDDVFDVAGDDCVLEYIDAHLDVVECVNQGEAINEYLEQAICKPLMNNLLVQNVMHNGEFHNFVVIQVPYDFISMASDYILKQGLNINIVASVTARNGSDMVSVSLRSRDVDVSGLAKLYGGGGHPHACGYRLPLKKARSHQRLVFNVFP